MATTDQTKEKSPPSWGGLDDRRRRRAMAVGLDPDHSNLLQICCAEYGLDPHQATCLDLASAKLGRRPGEFTEHDMVELFGAEWVLRIVD